jgi:hypothetical protein
MTNCEFIFLRVTMVFLLSAAFFTIQSSVYAQNNVPKETVNVLLIDSDNKGFSKTQSDLFFARLQKKISFYEMLSVYVKSDLMKRLDQNEKTVLDSCSALSIIPKLNCLQQLSKKIGTERIILCTVTRQENAYRFVSTEYGVKNYIKISEITEEAVCTSSPEINDYITRIAIAVGQKTTGTEYVPDSLSTHIPSWYWYAGGAVIAGIGTGLLLMNKQSSDQPVVEKTLPKAPALP